jgi:CRISPR type IV-associated protein Csf3
MQPLKITAVLQDGRIAGNESWFPLDSLLSSVWIRNNYPNLAYQHLANPADIIVADLPFVKKGAGDNWYWSCSFNTTKPKGEYISYWHKRFDDHLEMYIDFNNRRGKIDVKSGKYKAYRMPLVIQLFDKLVWYAYGEKEQAYDMCCQITHIGKKTSQGFGAVDYWMVEEWYEDRSEKHDGKLTRAIPMEAGLPKGISKASLAHYGIRPPYWLTENSRICYMPEVANECFG